MKRFLVFIAVALVLAVAAPVLAGPFSDVPQDHWAYSALEKLQATGILTGYADGTFQGKNTLTRYEIAVIVSKILDQVAAERALLSEKVDALENGLTAGQAEDVIAIFKSLLAKEEGEEVAQQPEQVQQPVTVVEKTTEVVKETEVVFPETLTDAQAAEVAAIVEALTMEFKFELQALGAKVDELTTKVDGIDARVATLEKNHVFWNGKYYVNFNNTILTGGTPYFDPFKQDYDEDDAIYAGYDYYTASHSIKHYVDLNMVAKTNNFEAKFDFVTALDSFSSLGSTLDLKNLSGTVTGNDFKATIGRDQSNVMTSYLFGDADAVWNGILVNVGNNSYAFIRDYELDDDENVVADDNIIAGKTSLGLLNSTLYFGVNDIVYSHDFVAGLNVPVKLLGLQLTTDAAVQKAADDYSKFVSVNGKTALGPLSLEGNYTLRDAAFAGLKAYGVKQDGYDAKANLNLFGDKVKMNARYNDYTDTAKKYDVLYGAGAEVAFGPLSGKFDKEMGNNDAQDIERTQGSVNFKTDIAFLNVAAGYKYDQYTDPTNMYIDAYGDPLLKYNRGTSDVTAKLFIPGLSATANYVYSLDGDYKFAGEAGLTTHKYGVTFAQGIVSANAAYELVAKKTTAGLTIDPKAINVLGFGIDTKAGVQLSRVTENVFNYNAAVDVTKALNDKVTLKYGYLYDSRDIAYTGDTYGELQKHTAGLDYALSTDLKATVSYTNMNFDGVDALESYTVDQFKAGVTLSF